jgi:YD repeat-containing protein
MKKQNNASRQMKNTKMLILIMASMMFISGCTTGQTPNQVKKKTSLEKVGLKGKVKSIRAIEYDVVFNRFGNIMKGSIKSYGTNYLWKYNEKGNMIEYHLFLDKYIYKYIYKYDKNDNLIEENEYNLDGSLDSKNTYKYDDKGNLVEKNEYDADGNLDDKDTYKYKYDDKGNLIEKIHDNTDVGKYTYKYDYKGNIIEENQYYSDGNLYLKSIYNDKGNMIEEDCYFSYNTYTRDNKGNEIKNDSGITYKATYKYNDKGNMIEMNKYYPYGGCWGTKYDNKGNGTSGSFSNWEYTYKYEYDEQGNWIKMITYTDGYPDEVTERTINYYE